MLAEDLCRVVAVAGKPISALRALDACGGSGTVAVKLLDLGVDVTVCDVSPELLQIYRDRCAARGSSPAIIQADIAGFLTETKVQYNLIVFSSALHHLEAVEEVLRLARYRLAPGGLVFTVFDPTPRARLDVRLLMWVDYLLFKVHRTRRDLPASVMRRARRMAAHFAGRGPGKEALELSSENLGVLAEYHVETGIDDLALATRLQIAGYEVVWHDRYASARYSGIRLALSWLGHATAFKLLLRKPLSDNGETPDG
jgi:SAM-dependent methyltransferase